MLCVWTKLTTWRRVGRCRWWIRSILVQIKHASTLGLHLAFPRRPFDHSQPLGAVRYNTVFSISTATVTPTTPSNSATNDGHGILRSPKVATLSMKLSERSRHQEYHRWKCSSLSCRDHGSQGSGFFKSFYYRRTQSFFAVSRPLVQESSWPVSGYTRQHSQSIVSDCFWNLTTAPSVNYIRNKSSVSQARSMTWLTSLHLSYISLNFVKLQDQGTYHGIEEPHFGLGSLWDLVQDIATSTRRLDASDPPDRIYAFIDIARLSQVDPVGIQPDYTLSCTDVYAKATHFFMQYIGPRLLETAVINHSRTSLLALPSWAVDWSLDDLYITSEPPTDSTDHTRFDLTCTASNRHVLRSSIQDLGRVELINIEYPTLILSKSFWDKSPKEEALDTIARLSIYLSDASAFLATHLPAIDDR